MYGNNISELVQESAKRAAADMIRECKSDFIFCMLQGFIDDNGNFNNEVSFSWHFDSILMAYQAYLMGMDEPVLELMNDWDNFSQKYDNVGWIGALYALWARDVQDHLIKEYLVRDPKAVEGSQVAWSKLQLKAREFNKWLADNPAKT